MNRGIAVTWQGTGGIREVTDNIVSSPFPPSFAPFLLLSPFSLISLFLSPPSPFLFPFPLLSLPLPSLPLSPLRPFLSYGNFNFCKIIGGKCTNRKPTGVWVPGFYFRFSGNFH